MAETLLLSSNAGALGGPAAAELPRSALGNRNSPPRHVRMSISGPNRQASLTDLQPATTAAQCRSFGHTQPIAPCSRPKPGFESWRGIPLRQVLERGLQLVLRGSPPAGRRFRLKTITTKGKGATCEGDWNTMRSMIYEGHGG